MDREGFAAAVTMDTNSQPLQGNWEKVLMPVRKRMGYARARPTSRLIKVATIRRAPWLEASPIQGSLSQHPQISMAALGTAGVKEIKPSTLERRRLWTVYRWHMVLLQVHPLPCPAVT